jgi:prophage endopeptidase
VIAVPSAPTFIVAIVAAACGAAAGYTWEHRARQAEVAGIRAEIARREAAVAEESRRRIEAASRAMDAALAEKDRRVLELDATNRRLRHDLKTAATGRPCLSADARGLLQQSPAFGLNLPTTTGSPLAAPAAPAADPGQSAGDSTDADLAGWVLDAAGLYEACRARIDALRQWDDEVNRGR